MMRGICAAIIAVQAAWAAAPVITELRPRGAELGRPFTLTAIVLTGLDLVEAGTVATIVVQVAGFAIPAVFTVRYPEHVRSRQDS